MSVLVQRVVGQLQLQEGHRLLHPVAPRGGGVRVEVRPAGGLRLRFSRHLPFLFIPLWKETRREPLNRDRISPQREGGREGRGLGGGVLTQRGIKKNRKGWKPLKCLVSSGDGGVWGRRGVKGPHLVPVAVLRDHVHQQDVLGTGDQSRQADLTVREHPPGKHAQVSTRTHRSQSTGEHTNAPQCR